MFRVDRKRGRTAESASDDHSYTTRNVVTSHSLLHFHGGDGGAASELLVSQPKLGVEKQGSVASQTAKPVATQTFTAEEDIRLVEEVLTHGLRFTMLSRLHSPSRSPDALRRRWSVLQLVLLHAAPTIAGSTPSQPTPASSEAWKNCIYQWHLQNSVPGARGLAGGRGTASAAMLAAQRVSEVVRGHDSSAASASATSTSATSSVASSAARETRSLSGMHPALYDAGTTNPSTVFRHQPTVLNQAMNLRSRSPTLRLPVDGKSIRRTNSPPSISPSWSGATASARLSPATSNNSVGSTSSAARVAPSAMANAAKQESMPWFVESETGVPACGGSYHPVAARMMESRHMPQPPAAQSRQALTDSPLPEMIAERAIRMIEEEAVQRFIDDLVEQTVAHGTTVTKTAHVDPAPSAVEATLAAAPHPVHGLPPVQKRTTDSIPSRVQDLPKQLPSIAFDAPFPNFVPTATAFAQESESSLPCDIGTIRVSERNSIPFTPTVDSSGDTLKQLQEAAQAVVVESSRPHSQMLSEPLTGLEPLLSVMEQVERTVHQQSSPPSSGASAAHARSVDFGHLQARSWGADQVQAAITANIHTQMYLQQATINHPPGNISLNAPPSEQQRALQEQTAMSRAGTATAVMAAWLGGSAAVTGWGFSTPLWSNVFEQPRCLWKSAVPRVLAYCLPIPCLYHVHLENFCPKRWLTASGFGCGAASQTCAGSPSSASSLLAKPTAAGLPNAHPATTGSSSAINTSGMSQTYGSTSFCQTDGFIQDPFRSKSPLRPRPPLQLPSRTNGFAGECMTSSSVGGTVSSILDSFNSGMRECELLAEIVAAANQRSREVAQVMIWF